MGEPIKVGDKAPDFTLKNQDNGDVTLSAASVIGSKVLLSFHPLAWTSICEVQMRALEIKQPVFEKLGVIPYGLSVDSVFCKKEWAKAIGLEKTLILADFWPHGEVAKQYGLFIEDKGISQRANVIIDATGTIEYVKVYEIPEIPDIEEIIRFLKA